MTTRDQGAVVAAPADGRSDATAPGSGTVRVAQEETRELRDGIAVTFAELAATLDGTAGIAERIAERAEECMRSELAASERQAAKRARKEARRARGLARPLRRDGRL